GQFLVGFFVSLEVLDVPPVINGGVFVDRSHEMTGIDLNAVVAIALGRTSTCRGAAKIDYRNAGSRVVVIMPTIDVSGEITELLYLRECGCIVDPPAGTQPLRRLLQSYGHDFTCGGAQATEMHKAYVRRVAKVVAQVQVMAANLQGAAFGRAPFGV